MRARNTVSYWEEQVSIWKQSGMSQKEFCSQNGLVYPTFNYWHRKLTEIDFAGPQTFSLIPVGMNLPPAPEQREHSTFLEANGLSMQLGDAVLSLQGRLTVGQLVRIAQLCDELSKVHTHVSA